MGHFPCPPGHCRMPGSSICRDRSDIGPASEPVPESVMREFHIAHYEAMLAHAKQDDSLGLSQYSVVQHLQRELDRWKGMRPYMIRAKFVVSQINQRFYNNGKEAVQAGTEIVLTPQYDTSIPEDQRFAKATPTGEVRMLIDNPAAVEYLRPGEAFYVDFTAVPKEEPAPA